MLRAAAGLFVLNAILCWPLFQTEYLDAFQSNEGVFIALGRFILEHWPHANWFPWFDGGTPLENAYSPLAPFLVAIVAGVAHCSPAHAFHVVAALAYTIGPVFLFVFARKVSGRLTPSFWAALAWSLCSPSDVVPRLLADIGGVWGSRRLRNIVFFGETPHNVALSLIPLALLLLVRSWEKRSAARLALCVVASAAVMLSNTFGIAAIAISFAILFLSLEGRSWRRLGSMAGVLCAAYLVSCRYLPPSLLRLVGSASQLVGGDFRFTTRTTLMTALLLLALAGLWIATQRFKNPMLTFAALFSGCFGGMSVLSYWREVALLPSAHRYVLEFEIGLLLLAAFALDTALRRAPGRTRAAMLAVAVVVSGLFAFEDYRFMRRLIQPANISQAVAVRQARWIEQRFPGQRVMVSGQNQFWLNVFTDNPQLSAGHEASAPNWMQRVAVFTIYSGQNAGDQDGPISVLWLKAFGCGAITVPGAASGDYFHPFVHPEKFEGLLPLVWREQDNSVYRVPLRSTSLAHVIPAAAVVARQPIHGLDVDPVRAYVSALDDPKLPVASLTWDNPERGRISARLDTAQVVSVQITYDPGWRASVGRAPASVRPDGLGMMVVASSCRGDCIIDLIYTGGTERRICSVVSTTVALALALMLVWPAAYFTFSSRSTLPSRM